VQLSHLNTKVEPYTNFSLDSDLSRLDLNKETEVKNFHEICPTPPRVWEPLVESTRIRQHVTVVFSLVSRLILGVHINPKMNLVTNFFE
jgi:hypothetical protein